jgi:hypothetical protein
MDKWDLMGYMWDLNGFNRIIDGLYDGLLLDNGSMGL